MEANENLYTAHNIKVDWTNDLLVASSLTAPGSIAQQVSLYDISGAGANNWIYAEEVNYFYMQFMADFNDFLYLQCGLDFFLFDLQILALDFSTSAPHLIQNYALAYVNTEYMDSHTCNGVYVADSRVAFVLLRYDDGTMYALEIDLDGGSQTDYRFDGNFRVGGYDNFNFQTATTGPNSLYSAAGAWYMAYPGSANGNKTYANKHLNLMAIDETLNCSQDIAEIDIADIWPYGTAVWIGFSLYGDYSAYFTANDDSANWSLGTAGTT